MIEIDEKIEQICKRRKFTSFWEAFDYMKLANYDEVEAIMIALQLFKGKIWDRVVYATRASNEGSRPIISSGFTTLHIIGDDNELGLDIIGEPDDMLVKLFIMTNEADEIYKPVYKAYAETREYAANETLEKHIKIITINLTTQLGIKLFNDWYQTDYE